MGYVGWRGFMGWVSSCFSRESHESQVSHSAASFSCLKTGGGLGYGGGVADGTGHGTGPGIHQGVYGG